MRIIGGSLKKRKISFINSSNTRPLRDIVRENIFNLISHSNKISVDLQQCIVLDLYSGVGSFGLETLSRGAIKVDFVEKNSDTLKILKKNIKSLSLQDKTEVYPIDVERFFQILKIDYKYNIIFLDPPYAEDNFQKILSLIIKAKIYNKNNLLIIHRENKTREFLNITSADELILTAQIFDHRARLESFEIGSAVCTELVEEYSKAAA